MRMITTLGPKRFEDLSGLIPGVAVGEARGILGMTIHGEAQSVAGLG